MEGWPTRIWPNWGDSGRASGPGQGDPVTIGDGHGGMLWVVLVVDGWMKLEVVVWLWLVVIAESG